MIDEIQKYHHDALSELADEGIPGEYRDKARVTIEKFWEWTESR